jgi:alpha-beta hydrolase superfamily lysophospholipase
MSVAYLFQKQIIFHPRSLAADYQYRFEEQFEEFFLPTSDGEKINTLYFKSKTTSNGAPKGIVLYFHGNADNLQRWGKHAADFTSRNYDFALIDYRGFGKSTGTINENAMYKDAQLLYNWALQKYPAQQIVIYGRSLGTAVASGLAAQVAAKALILETPFYNIKSVFDTQVPFLKMPFEMHYQFPTDAFVQKVKYPIHIIHGTKDEIVPYKCAILLKNVIKSTDEFITIEGGKHKNLNTFQQYYDCLDKWLN